jgi:hypothetical protein
MNWRNIWYDPKKERLRSGWRILAFLAMALAFSIPLFVLFQEFLPAEMELNTPPGLYYVKLIEVLAITPALIAAGVWALKVFDRLPARALGISFEGAWLRQLLLGIAAGLLLVGAALGLLWAGGLAKVEWQGAGKEMLLVLGASALFMLLVGLSEELLLRGYLFQTLLRGIGPLLTLFLTSVAFALFHISNDNWTLLGLTNIFLVGVLLGLLYLRSGSLWLPIGLHAGWNLAMVLFHVPVSGFQVSFSTPFLTTLTGHRLITGGAFGLEGGAVVSILLLGMIALAVHGRFGLPLDSRWWEWRDLALAPDTPQNWDFSVDSRYYQWKLLGHDQSE